VGTGRSSGLTVGDDGMQLFNEINLQNIRGDVFGGVTAAVIALPMALAFGVASGAGAEAGLYGAILVGLFAALFGGSPCLMSEPTGPMTVVFTAVLSMAWPWPSRSLSLPGCSRSCWACCVSASTSP
jgi:MFS superfamily sulfate permease-like transporter